MGKLIPFILLLILVAGYQDTKAQSLKNRNIMTVEQNKQIVIKFNNEFFAKGNTAIIKELLADTFINHTAPPNAPTDANVMI